MADVSSSVPDTPDIIDDFIKLFERRDGADARLRQARADQPLAWALVMAALSWDQVDRQGWRTPAVLCVQARRLMAAWGLRAESVDDADRVSAALKWAMREPALVECDDQGRYRPVHAVGSAVGSEVWREHHDAAVVSGVLIPLELVSKGDADHYANPADLDAAEVSYRLAVDSADPDAVALASLRLAQLAESREQPAEAARRYADVAALRHPVASMPAVLWLARQAAQDGDRPAARALAHEVVNSGDRWLLTEAWGLLGHLAWLDDDRDGAVAAMRLAVDTAGVLHRSYSPLLAEMLVACGDPSGAADTYRRLLIAAGEQFAADGKFCVIPGARPLLEYLSEAAPPDTATWAAISLAHLATMEGRPDDAEAAVRLAARHLSPDEVTAARELLRYRAPRARRPRRRR